MGVVSHLPKTVSRFDSRCCTNPQATLSKFTRHSSHKADDDFQYSGEALELRKDSFRSIRDSISSGGGAVVEEHYYTIKGDPLQIRREGDDGNAIF